ncbi:two-component system response regulator, partial [Mycobacterium tuberculosis UT0028]
LSLLRAPAH